jgi:hypothetical protein
VTWADYRAQCNRFMLEHAEALSLGWTEVELFALPDPGRPWNGGALWAFAGDDITEVTDEHMRAISRIGNVHSLQRCHIETETLGPLPWASSAAICGGQDKSIASSSR